MPAKCPHIIADVQRGGRNKLKTQGPTYGQTITTSGTQIGTLKLRRPEKINIKKQPGKTAERI